MKKNVLILGGTGELGEKVLDFFIRSGYNIIFSSTTIKKIKKTQSNILKNTKSIIGKICDFRKENDIKNIINFSYKKFKSINIIINCVGVFEYDDLNKLNYKKIINIFKINSLSLILINKFLRRIKKKDYIKVISIGSSSSYIGSKDTILYCGSKHALQGIIKSLNQTNYKKKIINYSINPGTLNNKMGKKVKNLNNQNLIEQDEIIKTISYLISLNIIGVPEDIYLRRFVN